MHISDGIMAPQVWAPLAVAGAAVVGLAARAARKRLADESIPLVGLMGAFVFAIQMLNFPVAVGVSDHIVGAGLLAIVFGPSVAVLCMSAVVVIQVLLFGDGGIAALGANVCDMAVISVLTAWAVHRAFRRAWPNFAVWAGTFAGVMAGSMGAAAWVMLSQPYGLKFLGAMMATHAVSGAVEMIVTVAVVNVLVSADVIKGGAPEVASA